MSPLLVSLLLTLPAGAPVQATAPPVAAPVPAVQAPAGDATPTPPQHRRRHRGSRHVAGAAPAAPPRSAPGAGIPRLPAQGASPAPASVAPGASGGPTQDAAAEQLAQAEARYRSALATTPGIAAYHESLALVLEREGRLQEALASHQQAVRLDSSSFRGQAGLGALLLKLGRPEEAVPHLRAAAAIDRTSIEVRKALGAALLQLGQRDAALVALREARQLDSSDSDIERSLRQAEATAPGKDRLNDGTAMVDHPVGRAIRRALEWLFGVVLVSASVLLLVPLLSGPVIALARRVRAAPPVAA